MVEGLPDSHSEGIEDDRPPITGVNKSQEVTRFSQD